MRGLGGSSGGRGGRGSIDLAAVAEEPRPLNLVFLSRPSQTLAEAGLVAPTATGGGLLPTATWGGLAPTATGGGLAVRSVYWASELMRFQEDAAAIATACDAELKQAAEEAAKRRAAALKRAAHKRMAGFWTLPLHPWPFPPEPTPPHSHDGSKQPAEPTASYYGSEETFCGEEAMGESWSLSLSLASGTFRHHRHTWSDAGDKTRHTHEMIKGAYRIQPLRGHARAKTPGAHTLTLMPTAKLWTSKPPPRWEDEAAFTQLPRGRTEPIEQCSVDADVAVVDGHTLARSRPTPRAALASRTGGK
jgi:hypothetical protein